MKLLYQVEPGEQVKLLTDGRAIVTHPDRLPKIVTADGKVETLTRKNHPEVWAQFEAAINAILRLN